jgi:5-deoxy-D-glucuronate isomerase
MSEELVTEVQTEVERISSLPLAEQDNDFSALRDKLESILNDSDSTDLAR